MPLTANPQRLSYYASLVTGKVSQFETPGEGYRIYKDVPIARTGSQQYLGREIKKNPGYKPEWGIADDEIVTVYRPIEEVTAPETLASFEGKSVLDEHPPDPHPGCRCSMDLVFPWEEPGYEGEEE